jgi:hypothetical protein
MIFVHAINHVANSRAKIGGRGLVFTNSAVGDSALASVLSALGLDSLVAKTLHGSRTAGEPTISFEEENAFESSTHCRHPR